MVLYYTSLERFARDKHSSLLDTVVSYKENKCCEYQPLGQYSQHFNFFVTYKLPQ
jgi:hypothetical protein